MIPPPTPAVRRTVAGLSLSAAALVGILLHEGYTDRAVTVSYTHLTLPTSDLV